MRARCEARGFTIIELLVVVVIIGIVAAIAIPGSLNAVDRGKQKRTMADLKTLATAVESYSLDESAYPNTTVFSTMVAGIEGLYLKKVPSQDGWGNPLLYDSDGVDYTVGSVGKDGGGSLTLDGTGGPKHGFAFDIVFVNGAFLQWPEGVQ